MPKTTATTNSSTRMISVGAQRLEATLNDSFRPLQRAEVARHDGRDRVDRKEKEDRPRRSRGVKIASAIPITANSRIASSTRTKSSLNGARSRRPSVVVPRPPCRCRPSRSCSAVLATAPSSEISPTSAPPRAGRQSGRVGAVRRHVARSGPTNHSRTPTTKPMTRPGMMMIQLLREQLPRTCEDVLDRLRLHAWSPEHDKRVS